MNNNNQLGMNNAGLSSENVHVEFSGDNHFGEWILGAISPMGPDEGGMLHFLGRFWRSTLHTTSAGLFACRRSGHKSWRV